MAALTFTSFKNGQSGPNKRLVWVVIAFIGVFPLTIFLVNSSEKANLQSRLGRFILNSTQVETGRAVGKNISRAWSIDCCSGNNNKYSY
jgi:hypothetical protein